MGDWKAVHLPDLVTVQLYGSLTQFTGGEASIEVKASTVRDVFRELLARFPALGEDLDTRVSVSVDGRIYTESLFQSVTPENEIILLPRIAGG
ncbi:MAG: MoaD/ThiS family protein [Pseudomonadota bacterium]